MKAIVPYQAFKDAVLALTGAIESKASIDTHQSLKFSFEGNRVHLFAFNSRLSVKKSLECWDVEDPVEFGVPAALLKQIVSAVQPKDLTISIVERQVTIASGRSRYKLPMVIGDRFPSMAPKAGEALEFNIQDFVKSLKKVSFAKIDNEANTEGGVYCDGEFFAATDKIRLACYPNKVAKTPSAVILPGDVAEYLPKLFKGSSAVGRITVDDMRVRIQTEDTDLVTMTIVGTFPPFRNVMASFNQHELKFKLKRTEFADFIRRAIVIGVDAVTLTIKPDGIDVYAKSNTGDANDTYECATGGSGTIMLNGRLLYESLVHLEAEEVDFVYKGKTQPCAVLEGDYGCYLTPIRF